MSPAEPVIAGSRGFALALLAPLTERLGTRPRIAADPARARPFCTGPGALVVVEFFGADTLRAIRDLVLLANGTRIVAAVPERHAAADAPLRALGVDVARWDGTAADVVAAVGRQLERAAAAPRAHAAAVPPAGASGAPAPAAPAPARAPARPLPAAAPAARTAATPPPVIAPAAQLRPVQHVAAPSPSAAEAAGMRGRPGATPPPLPWPTSVPGRAEVEAELRYALAGVPHTGPPLAGMAEVLAGLSLIERDVLCGKPLPLDPRPIRDAAVMRVRVAAALATAPAQGGAVDAEAVSAFLAEIDELLSKVKALSQSAPAEALPALEAVRNALVREAIAFSEAVPRAATPAEASARRPAPSPRAPRARVLPASRVASARPALRRRALWTVLAVAVVGAAAFHGYRQLRRSRLQEGWPGRAGAPANAVIVAGPNAGDSAVIRSKDGRPFSPEELKHLREMEALEGSAVIEMGPGLLMIVPSRPGGPMPFRASPAR